MTRSDAAKLWRPTLGFGLGGAAIALLTWLAFTLHVGLAIVALLDMIVIVQVSTMGNLVPAVALALIAAASIDFFFTQPIFSFRMDQPEDIVAVVVFVSTAVIITTLVRRGRRLAAAAALSDQLRLVIDTIPAVVWSNLPDGSTQFLNQRFRDYSGLGGEEARATGWLNCCIRTTARRPTGTPPSPPARRSKGRRGCVPPMAVTAASCCASRRCLAGTATSPTGTRPVRTSKT
jgi:PAS domain-containing protein